MCVRTCVLACLRGCLFHQVQPRLKEMCVLQAEAGLLGLALEEAFLGGGRKERVGSKGESKKIRSRVATPLLVRYRRTDRHQKEREESVCPTHPCRWKMRFLGFVTMIFGRSEARSALMSAPLSLIHPRSVSARSVSFL